MSQSIREILEGWDNDDDDSDCDNDERGRPQARHPRSEPDWPMDIRPIQGHSAVTPPPHRTVHRGDIVGPWATFPAGGIIPPVAVKRPPGSGWGDFGNL